MLLYWFSFLKTKQRQRSHFLLYLITPGRRASPLSKHSSYYVARRDRSPPLPLLGELPLHRHTICIKIPPSRAYSRNLVACSLSCLGIRWGSSTFLGGKNMAHPLNYYTFRGGAVNYCNSYIYTFCICRPNCYNY